MEFNVAVGLAAICGGVGIALGHAVGYARGIEKGRRFIEEHILPYVPSKKEK
jgi:hypothetical protein